MNTNKASISIVTVSYNSELVIAENLRSVLDQGADVEHLIIDGGSTDSTLEVVRTYPHVRQLVSEPDAGIYDAMNKGIRLAEGGIIGFLNADDYFANGQVLTRVAKVFSDPSIDACYGDLIYFDREEDASKTAERESQGDSDFRIVRYWKSGNYSPDKFYRGWMPPHPTFFVRRTIYEKFGGFVLSLGTAADYELMLRFLLKHKIRCGYVPEVLVNMRVGGVSNISIKNRLNAHNMDRKAWQVNGLQPRPWTLFLKPLSKIPQWWRRPA